MIYSTIIIAGLKYTGWERMLPPQMNSVAVTTLAVLFVTSLQLLLHHRAGVRSTEQFLVATQLAATSPNSAGVERRGWVADEPPTVRNAIGASGVYLSASIATVQPAVTDALVDSVADRVGSRFSEQIEDLKHREFWRGFNSCAKGGLDGVGADVLPLPGARNGRPPTR